MKKHCPKKVLAILLAFTIFNSTLVKAQSNILIQDTQVASSVTRGEFAKIINTYMSLEPKEGTNFNDVSASNPYSKDLATAKQVGYLKGDGFGNVYPDKAISGAEASVTISNLLGFDLSKVTVDNTLNMPTWAKPAASNLIDLTMITKELAEKTTLTADDANKFGASIATAKLFSDSPFALKQASMQDDFYNYTNRKYLATATVLPGYMGATTFTDISIMIDNQIKDIVQDAINSKDIAVNSDAWKMKEIYNMYMDNNTRTKSFEKIKPVIADIKNAKSLADLASVRNKYIKQFGLVNKLYSSTIISDAKNDASKWAYMFTYGSLGLPTKDYYADDANMKPIQDAYKKWVVSKLAYMGETENLETRANAYYAFEKSLADKQKPLAEQANYPALFVQSTWAEVDALGANIEKDVTVPSKQLDDKIRTLNVYCVDKEHLKFANSLYTEENITVLKDMMLLSVIDSVGGFLGDDYQKISEEMKAAAFGDTGQLPQELKAQNTVQIIMPNTISKIYTEKHTDKKVKEDITKMCEEIRDKRIERVSELTWMSQKTKDAAIDKLKSIKFYIAYPDKFDQDIDFNILSKDNGGTLIDIFLNSTDKIIDKQLEYLSKPANEIIWESTVPYMVNAFYNPFSNAIIVPNGILQDPIYNINKGEAYNLGGIGAVIGHEFTHAIDNNGASFDKNGTITNWWTDADYKAFQALTTQIAGEVSKISIGDGMQVNGALASSEVIADLGGITASLDVATDKNLDLKSVFSAWSTAWAARYPKQIALMLLNDVHAPNMVRVNFTFSNQDEFYKTYDIKQGDKMYIDPEKRLNIW